MFDCNMEIWKDIPGYEGNYQVSTFGNVRSVDRTVVVKRDTTGNTRKPATYTMTIPGKPIVPKKTWDGYLTVSLSLNGSVKIKRIQQLVAVTFIPNPNNYPQINHKDEDKTNNHVLNLEWCDARYNNNYGNRNSNLSKAKQKLVLQYNKEGQLLNAYNSVSEASLAVGISHSGISACANGKQSSAGGFIWRYD